MKMHEMLGLDEDEYAECVRNIARPLSHDEAEMWIARLVDSARTIMCDELVEDGAGPWWRNDDGCWSRDPVREVPAGAHFAAAHIVTRADGGPIVAVVTTNGGEVTGVFGTVARAKEWCDEQIRNNAVRTAQ